MDAMKLSLIENSQTIGYAVMAIVFALVIL
jgi:hypothetical protein